jgi:putative ATP-dependent endonuclease of the OLD family
MEEPEIAIPPHTQKRIIDSVCQKSAQALFTSHSPFVIAEFKPSQVLVLERDKGILSGVLAEYPPAVKPKEYRTEFRSRFCEALLARRVLVLEGRTEFDAIPAAAKRLHELHPEDFKPLDALGIACIDAETDSQVAPLGEYFKKLGKIVFAVFDKQAPAQRTAIVAAIPHPFEAPAKTFEKVILDGTAEAALRRFGVALVADGDWPPHLARKKPTATMPLTELKDALSDYLSWSKGHGTAADLLGQCTRDEMPTFIVETLSAIQAIVEPPPPPPEEQPQAPPLVAAAPPK